MLHKTAEAASPADNDARLEPRLVVILKNPRARQEGLIRVPADENHNHEDARAMTTSFRGLIFIIIFHHYKFQVV